MTSKTAKFIINNENFYTKKALQDKIKEILWKYNLNEIVNNDDFDFLCAVFKYHPDSDLKVGSGINYIKVKQNPVYTNTRGFWLYRLDGTDTDISYTECLTPTSKRKKVYNACRTAIEPSILAFKNNIFLNATEEIYCPYTNEKLTFYTSHVDHEKPLEFLTLINMFITQYRIDIDSISINDATPDGIVQDKFNDKVLEQLWIDFHNSHAKLRVLSKYGNLSHARK